MPDRHLLTLTAVLGLLGFLLVTSVLTGSAERRRAAPRKAQLVELIDQRRSLVDDLDQAVEELRFEVAQSAQRSSRSGRSSAIASDLAEQAGTVPLRGRGLVVTLSDSDREPPSADEAGAYRIHDTDLQLVVNALWAAGAEAIAVNGSRLVATTPIRSAGGTIVVNFRPLSPPYRIDAVGAGRNNFAASEIATRFRRWETLFGLGFSVRASDAVTVPGYTGRVTISSASPAGQEN